MVRANPEGHRGKYSSAAVGKYIPVNREKYIGLENPEYKSKLELKFMRYLDKSNKVVWWKYEPNYIYYMDMSSKPPVKRKYFIDFTFKTIDGKIFWVEIKSSKEVSKPKNNNPRDMQIWLKNTSKWKAAKLLAESQGYNFKIITEKQLS